MADDYHDLDVRIRELREIVIELATESKERWRYYDQQFEEQRERRTSVPVLAFAGISAISGLIIGGISLLLQIWLR